MSQPPAAPSPSPAKPAGNQDAMTLDEKGLAEAGFPGDFRPEFRVHVDATVHDDLVRHAAETTDLELCGVLVGRMQRDRNGPYLTITGSIRGEHAQNDGAQVKFTHATWDHIHEVKDKRFPKDGIVGWYHTHPGFGIFLSGMDAFIQEFFFNGAQQIALVIDPRSGEEGIFVWRGGKIERATRFWIGSSERACAGGPIDSRPRPAPRPAATSGQAPAAPSPEEADEDDLDLWGFARKTLPITIALLAGFFLARLLAPVELRLMRDDLLRAEVRNLVGDAAQAWSSSDDLRGIEKRLGEVIASVSTATGGSASPAAFERELRDVQKQVADLKALAIVREDAIAHAIQRRASLGATIEDELNATARESAKVRRLTVECYLLLIKMRLDGKELPQKEKDALREVVENALAVEPSEEKRESYRRIFPELYTQPKPEAAGTGERK